MKITENRVEPKIQLRIEINAILRNTEQVSSDITFSFQTSNLLVQHVQKAILINPPQATQSKRESEIFDGENQTIDNCLSQN